MNHEDLPNIASPTLGTEIVFATDEWFAAAENVISDDEPVWKSDVFTPFGKWMDGWESRRRRTQGHDWAIIRLGLPAIIRAIEVDTCHFTGNFSPKCSILGIGEINEKESSAMEDLVTLRNKSIVERADIGRMGMCATPDEWKLASSINFDQWTSLVHLQPLGAGYEQTRKTLFKIENCESPIRFLRLNMGPDGGIARIRVFGEISPDLTALEKEKNIDLVAVEHGGLALSCSNRHFGHPRNMLAPGRGNCMGDGWETARQPNRPAVYQIGPDGLLVLPGYDWAVLQMGIQGSVHSLEIDTNFFLGNYPESCLVEGCFIPNKEDIKLLLVEETHSHVTWKTLLPRVKLGPNMSHVFSLAEGKLNSIGPLSHLKLTIYPDGGVMRIRVIGQHNVLISKL